MKRIYFRIGTGGDDLRGGQNNLNIGLLFANNSVQSEANVNRGANWPNNSVRTFIIALEHPTPVSEIKGIRLFHIANGSVRVSAADATLAAPITIPQGIQTDDNWDMAYLEAQAEGDGWGAQIAAGKAYRFTGQNSTLVLPTIVPRACRASARSGSDSGPLLSNVGGSGSGGLLSGGGENPSGRGPLLGPARAASSGSSLSAPGPALNSIAPRNNSNAASGSAASNTDPSLQPLVPRNSTNSGSNVNSGAGSGKALTNADVVKMVRANLPEQAILASINTHPSEFDVSESARKTFDKECAAIQHPGLSTSSWGTEVKNIWNAMMNAQIAHETNGRGGEDAGVPNTTPSSPKDVVAPGGAGRTVGTMNNGTKEADELSPQPYPPKGGKALGSAVTGKGQLTPPSKLLKGRLGPAKKGPTIANAAAASHKAAMFATLRSQRTAADAQAAQMKTAVRMASQLGASPGPSRTMSASGSTGLLQPNGQTAPKAQASAMNTAKPAQNPGGIAPQLSQTMGPQENQTVACSQDPTMRIFQVSGTDGAVTFTTDPTGNFYTITGCSFGPSGGNAKAYLYYQNSFHQEFQIQEWNDYYIKCNLDPTLTGVGDLNNLTLVIQRSDGTQAIKTGLSFYAMRETRRLATFPQQYFSLSRFNTQNLSDVQGGIQSPVDPTGSFPNNTAEGYWYDQDLQLVPNKGFVTAQSTPPSGTDIYDFGHLVPGFEVTSAGISWPDPSAFCSAAGGNLVATTGSFGGQFNGSQLRITWQGWNCNVKPCTEGGAFSTDCFGLPPLITDYGLDVIVEGPRGLDPWTGQAIGQ